MASDTITDFELAFLAAQARNSLRRLLEFVGPSPDQEAAVEVVDTMLARLIADASRVAATPAGVPNADDASADALAMIAADKAAGVDPIDTYHKLADRAAAGLIDAGIRDDFAEEHGIGA